VRALGWSSAGAPALASSGIEACQPADSNCLVITRKVDPTCAVAQEAVDDE